MSAGELWVLSAAEKGCLLSTSLHGVSFLPVFMVSPFYQSSWCLLSTNRYYEEVSYLSVFMTKVFSFWYKCLLSTSLHDGDYLLCTTLHDEGHSSTGLYDEGCLLPISLLGDGCLCSTTLHGEKIISLLPLVKMLCVSYPLHTS